MIFRDLTETVGHTPLVELARIGAGLPARVVGKLEMFNPLGSVKDRVAVALIDDAERRGIVHHAASEGPAVGLTRGPSSPISLPSTTLTVARLGVTESAAPAERNARSPAHHQT